MCCINNIFLDMDGTLTDGKIYYSSSGEEIKVFNIKDGLLLSALIKAGFRIVIITGRNSIMVSKRMSELGITEVYQGICAKDIFIEKYIREHHLSLEESCYIGDDLNDLAAMKVVRYKACPENACKEIKELCEYISTKEGGNGAVRDCLEFLLKRSNQWNTILKQF